VNPLTIPQIPILTVAALVAWRRYKVHPSAKPRLFRVPPLPANYIARPGPLAALRSGVTGDKAAPHVALTAVKGMGGIGKTVYADGVVDILLLSC
jgi:hypothetical protein